MRPGHNEHESQWLKDVLIVVCHAGFTQATAVVADGGYQGREFECAMGGYQLQVVKRSDVDGAKLEGKSNTFKPLPRRWVIECTFGDLMFSRVLSCCYERLTECAEANVLWANIRLILKRWQQL